MCCVCFSLSLAGDGATAGAEIQTSLLEKARVSAFFDFERNFHVFYMARDSSRMLLYFAAALAAAALATSCRSQSTTLRHACTQLCHYKHTRVNSVDTSDAETMLGGKTHRLLRPASHCPCDAAPSPPLCAQLS